MKRSSLFPLTLLVSIPAHAAGPLPVPCAANCTAANLNFQQYGNATAATTGNTMTVTQQSPTAVLNWQSFNINPGYTVNFVQPSATASALNRIWDANPTTIAGNLNANGQIYLINQSGIVFAGSAQVNVGGLIASSLDISDSLYKAGYLTANLNVPNSSSIQSAFSGSTGFIRVDTGAVVNGSKIMMFAPVVENSGSISTTDGQAVLAAGNKVYLEASQDPNLRGVLVEVDVSNPGAKDATAAANGVQNNASGSVSNLGSVLSQRGNITLVGYAVNQQGMLSATTSVTENGSIKLLARYQVDTALSPTTHNISENNLNNTGVYDIRATQTGNVTLGKNSVTQVTPELTDASTTTDGQGFNPSIIEAMGNTVDVAGSIIAPGGKVTLVAAGSIDPSVGAVGNSGNNLYQEINSALPYSSFINPNYIPPANVDGASVVLENGSLLDVSGSSASVSVARNILFVQLRGTQLADAPVQKNGFLWGKNVYVDIRKGTTLANITGDEAQIGRAVAERTATGGKVVIASTDKAVLNPGSTINISGGQVNYTGAYINTTSLISNGVAYDIANASPNLIYDGMSGMVTVSHSKWGVTESWATAGTSNTVWDPGYVQGMSAGSVTVLSPNAAIGGKIVSNTVSGAFQRMPYVDPETLADSSYKNTWQMAPKGGSLIIGSATPTTDASGNSNFVVNNDVTVQSNPVQANYAPGDTLPSTITVDSRLFSNGLNNLSIYTNGTATIAAGTSLNLASGGSVVLKGGQVDMKGSIATPGGAVTLATVRTSGHSPAGAVTVAGSISTRGTWVNDSLVLGSPDLSIPIVENGGNISIKSGTDVNIAGSTLDASAGGYVDQSGKIHGGNGGNISISSGMPGSGANYQIAMNGAKLQSYGVNTGKGGSLAITGGDVQIGGSASSGTILLPASFFQQGGFSSYSITAQGLTGLTVADNTQVSPQSLSLILNPDAVLQPSGTDVFNLSNPGFLPEWQRNPASITLTQNQVNLGALIVGLGSRIQVDPGASITLNSNNQLTVLGTLDAPAGNINLNLNLNNSPYSGMQSIWLGSQSRILAQGYFLQSQPDSSGLVRGQMLSGGTINIHANGGFFVANTGSNMDVSGTNHYIDVPTMNSGSLVYSRADVAGNAGSISVSAVDGAIFDGSMNGSAGGSQAAAGSFSFFLDGKGFTGAYDTTTPIVQAIQKSTSWNVSVSGNSANPVTPGSDSRAGNKSLQSAEGQAYIDPAYLNGFDQISLKSYNSIGFADNVNLTTKRSISLDTPLITAGAGSTLNSAHVTLGNLDAGNQVSVTPVSGSGSLNVQASLVDISGNVSIGNASSVKINSSGDIRLNGVLDKSITAVSAQSLKGNLSTQGDITLTANQVYTSTLAQYAVSSPGTITVLPNDAANPSSGSSPVLSAGGSLTLNAANIFQSGVLKAPMGTIDLKGGSKVTLGYGSTTSVSLEGQTVPFGLIQGGSTWYYDPLGNGNLVTISSLPQKAVKLEGPSVTVVKGSTVDLSGGGDLYASEFFAGIGGTVNVLDPAKAPANTYAIVPGISGYSPYDPQSVGQYAGSGSKTTLGNDKMVYLSGGNGLAAGYYSLLPANYALLPGAYRVTAVSGYQDLQPGQAVRQADGTQIMAGKFAVAGTNIMDARWSGFAVSSGSIVRTQSEFHDSHASTFFSSGIPADAGQLVVNASGANAYLALDGAFKTMAGSGGRGAWIDLSGPAFDIVNAAGTGTAGGVELTTAMLDNLGAGSLLIGGTRTQTSSGVSIAVGASSVTVENSGATLSGSDIMLAADNTVTVKSGSGIQGSGASTNQPASITVDNSGLNKSDNGVLLRVSSGPQATVSRLNILPSPSPSSSNPTPETITVESGATIASSNSVLLDATNATSISDKAIVKGQAFSVAASGIDIGSGGASSLSLTPALLAQMGNFQELALHSYGDINFFGNAGIGSYDAATGKYGIASLTLNAKSLNGNNSTSNAIYASTVTLMNNNGSATPATPSGSGNLKVTADNIVLSNGTSTLQGFDAVAFDAAQNITGKGTGGLNVSAGNGAVHTLNLSGTITGVAKSVQTIDASAYDIAIKPATGLPVANADVGAKLSIKGSSITDTGSITLASGSVTLHAVNNLTLDSGSSTSAAGIKKSISGQSAYAPAGSVTLVSDSGNVAVNGTIDVSGGAGDAGTLTVNVINGSFADNGTMLGSAASGNVQGSFAMDTRSIASLDSLIGLLNSGGFTGALDMRVRSGDVALGAGSVVKASSYHLSADSGKIDVYGKIDVSGSKGGDILLAAANDLTLQSGTFLNASGSNGAGGKVSLETVNGAVNLMNGSSVDASGTTPGTVLLRAPQINNGGDVAVNTAAGTSVTIKPGANVTLEGYKNYIASSIGASDIATTSLYYTDAMNFASNAGAIRTRLGNSGVTVLPGIQISSPGDLTLATNWDLHTWRFNDGSGNLVPGMLTLKAANNLNFGSGATIASLSDGFTSATGSTLTNDSSWSYRLVAGSDSSAANVMAVNNSGSGNVILAPGLETTSKIAPFKFEMIRTGTGSIDISAGGGLYLGNRDSVIYTAGQLASNIPANIGASATKAFTTGGGDVAISVKGDINANYGDGTTPGTAVNQLITDWLWRQGSASTSTAWWINFGTFTQNIGALGGGNVNISSGGNITNLSAVVPTTGYVDAAGNVVTSVADSTGKIQPLGGGNLSVKAGGNINSGIFYVGNGQGTVMAGGSLGASRFDQANNNMPLYTILALQQGNFAVRTNGDLNLQTVLNPTIVAQGSSQKVGTNTSFFFSYGSSSGVSLSSLNGNILLSNSDVFNNDPFFNLVNNHGGSDIPASMVYPSNLQATALNGGVAVNSFTLFPSANGNLKLLAGSDINIHGVSYMSDAYLNTFQASSPFAQFTDVQNALSGHGTATSTSILPLHNGDNAPVSIVAGGSIYGDNVSSPDYSNLNLSKSAQISAGQDIVNLSASIQNLTSSDITSFTAGRDIVFTTNAASPNQKTQGITVYGPGQLLVQAGRDVNLGQSNGLLTSGNLQNPYLPDQGAGITVLAGVGSNAAGTQAFIGKYIAPATGNKYTQDLASYISNNVDPSSSTGKNNIPYLISYLFDPSTTTGQANGATLTAFVVNNGASPSITPADAYTYLKTLPISTQTSFAYDFFKAQSVQNQAAYVASGAMQGSSPDLISFVNNHGGNVTTGADAYNAFQKMSVDLRNAFANQVFFDVLRTSGRSAASSGNYSAGYDAISTLFPVTNPGDVSLYYSQIKTVRGGNIDILAPGGNVNAGLANPSSNGPTKTAAELGVVTVKGGDVNAFVNKDFLVNQSRVFTLQGGNILMWSSYGNLDAGKGSKTVSSTPPPLLVVDPKTGAFNVDVTQSVVGSGIRVLLANSNIVPGSVDLYAPSGAINAGDAGIGSAGNIYLGALHVIGADNINFGGVSVGVPVATTSSLGGLAGIGNFQGAAQAADQATQSLGNKADNSELQKALSNFKPLFLSVDVIGLGNQVFGP